MSVKAVLCASTLLLAVLICGCTTTTQESTVAPAETPSFLGNWTGTMVGYTYGVGYTDFSGYTISMSVTKQQDRIFSGEITFTNQSGSLIREASPCAGVIGRDGKTFTLVEHDGGHSAGSLIAPDEIEIIHSDGEEPFSIAIDSLKKS